MTYKTSERLKLTGVMAADFFGWLSVVDQQIVKRFVSTKRAILSWLLDFERDPVAAVGTILWQKGTFEDLKGLDLDPGHLLLEWALEIKNAKIFLAQLDEALAQWVHRTWGQIPSGERRSSVATARAWMRLMHLISNINGLQLTVRALRQYFDERQTYLGALSIGPNEDVLGKYLYVIALYQEDRSLLNVWWNYCNLPAGIPWYHGKYGIWGLCGMPRTEKEQRNGFPELSGIGLARLARSLYLQTRHKALRPDTAEEEFKRVVRPVLKAYPFHEKWLDCWSRQVTSLRLHRKPVEWMNDLVPGLIDQQVQKRPRDLERSQTWKEQADRIVEHLKSDFESSLSRAEHLIKQERLYAERTGDSFAICRSLTRFSSTILDKYPNQALEWAEEAHMWEPWNPYTWTTLVQATKKERRGELDSAINIAWQAAERFPEEVVVHTVLGEVLKEAGRLEEAEQLYRETIENFPDNIFARNGLADVLKLANRLPEAEELYRETIQRFPKLRKNTEGLGIARCGLADVLKAKGELIEAEKIYREIIRRFKMNHEVFGVARNGLADVLKLANRLPEAEELYRETLEIYPDNIIVRNGLASILRLLGRLTEALELVDQNLKQYPADTATLTEKGRILQELNQFEKAKAVFDRILETTQQKTKPEEYEGKLEEVKEAKTVFDHTQGATRPKSKPSDEYKIKTEEAKEKSREEITIAEATAKSAYARFLRLWANRNDSAREASKLRNQALKILNELIKAKPYMARAYAEKGLVQLDSRRYDQAKRFLSESLELFPGNAVLRYALVRAERQIARLEHRYLDQSQLDALTRNWNSLCRLNSALIPLENIGKARALLAHVDGQIISRESLKSLQTLRIWMQPHLSMVNTANGRETDDPATIRQHYRYNKNPTFEKWWSREIQAYLFGPLRITATMKGEDLELIKKRLEKYSHPINVLEEAFLVRLYS